MEPQQALKLLVGILNQATLINRGGGRESGLTLEDRTAIGQAARAIDHGFMNMQSELETKNDEIARLTSEIDQLKSEIARDPNVSSM